MNLLPRAHMNLLSRAAASGRDAPVERSPHAAQVTAYYRSIGSRLGYSLLLGGAKHYGYYRPGDNQWRLRAALRRMEDHLARTLDLSPGSRVLDAGCGTGVVACRLATVHGLHVTGVDILDWNIIAAQQRAHRHGVGHRAQFEVMDYTRLEFPDETFDGAYTMETLVHSDSVETVLAGLYRVLKPGGRLVHFEYSRKPEHDCTPEESRVLREVNLAAVMPGLQRLEHGLLEQLLGNAGFSEVTSRDISERALPMHRVFALLAGIPYAFAERFGDPRRMANAMAAVELYRHQETARYRVYQARKPYRFPARITRLASRPSTDVESRCASRLRE